jgi:hypothetical protein
MICHPGEQLLQQKEHVLVVNEEVSDLYKSYRQAKTIGEQQECI